MAKERTQKSKYPSRFSPGGWVSAAQYITEIICEKKCKFDSRASELPFKFWELPEWAKFYRSQIATANKLIKEFGEAAVIQALKDPKAFRTYSLRAPFFKGIIERHKVAIDRVKKENENVKYDIPESTDNFRSSPIKKQSGLSKLRGLEDE